MQPFPEHDSPQASGAYHVPVMLAETLAFLQPRSGGVYVDGTLGGGGHTEAILQQSEPDGIVLGIDRDPEALAAAGERLACFGNRFRAIHATFDQIATVTRAAGFAAVDGVLLDLGVSSRQLDRAARGFSFRQDAPLDMRMDPTEGMTAAEAVNTLSDRELERILREYGEERFAGRIARAIARARLQRPIETTGALAQIVSQAVPGAYRHGRIDPSTRTFQALRIYVNRELELLEAGLQGGVELLRPGGRIVVIAYHSLEDRIVKHTFRELAGKGRPAGEGEPPVLGLLTAKPAVPETTEMASNPRARSAKLRAAEKI